MKYRDHRKIIEHERKNPAGNARGYAGFVAEMLDIRTAQLAEWRDRHGSREFDVNDVLAAYQHYPPEKFSKAYDLDEEALENGIQKIQRKYLLRYKNIRRSWSRLLRYLPEVMNNTHRYRVLEMSTGHGATLEILKHFGHEAVGNDYSNAALTSKTQVATPYRKANQKIELGESEQTEWPYKPIIDSLGLNVDLFDAGVTPYPYKKNAFDIVLCFDALEHYCHPRNWMTIIDEFVRIAKKTVIVEINPIRKQLIDDESYTPYVQKFYDDILKYNKNGFQCVGTGTSFNQPRFFKMMHLG
jgi:SAM-dependent methyltransferase